MTKSTSMKPIKCIALSLLLSLTAISSAQPGKFEIGVDAGPSVRDLWFPDASSPFIGLSSGLSFQYNVNRIFSIKTGISYDLKGTTSNSGVYIIPPIFIASSGIVNLHYLTLPVMAKASFGRRIKFFIDAGPYLSVLVEANERYIEAGINSTTVNLYKHGDLKPIDVGIQAGVGITIPIKPQFEFSFEDRNSIGLLNIRQSGYAEIKTFSSSFLLGFNYRFGKGNNTNKTSHT